VILLNTVLHSIFLFTTILRTMIIILFSFARPSNSDGSSADAAIEAKLLSAVADFLGNPPQKQDGADQFSERSSLRPPNSVQREERKIGEVRGKVIRRVPKARGVATTMKDKVNFNSNSTISKGNSNVEKRKAALKLTGEIFGGSLDSTEKLAKGLAVRSQPLLSLSTINNSSQAVNTKNWTQSAGGSRRVIRRRRPLLPPSRDSRFLSLFTMVSFPNILCTTTTQLNGTCYPLAECQNRRGTPQVYRVAHGPSN
jgi:hypothetical protein